MYKRHEIGKIGEDVATRYLLQKNYEIIERNFKCKQGEIDIIAKENNYLVFVEVKTRSNLLYGTPAESVNYLKRQHILKSAKVYLKLNNMNENLVRFDVIEVYVLKNRCNVNQIKQII